MATNNTSNQSFTNNADGFALGGGTTPRAVTLSGGNVAIVGSGAAVITMPTVTDTLVGKATTDTLTNKSISGATNTLTAISESSVTNLVTDLGAKAPLASPTFTGIVTIPTGASITTPTLTTPKINQINDTNGSIEIMLTATASSVNYLNLVNGITGSDLQLQAGGTDANTSVNIVPKGTGVVKAGGVAISTISSVDTLTNKTLDSTSPTAFFYPGFLQATALRTAPTGWLMCYGQAVSRAIYSALFSGIVPSLGTVTIAIASPGVVSLTAHGFLTGDMIYLTTTGALPTGLTANTVYYVIYVDANSFRLATSNANALAGTAINTSGTQSGTHTMLACPYGLGDGSTTFNIPDLRGRVLAGNDAMGGTGANRLTLTNTEGVGARIGSVGGEQSHTLTVAELAAHAHPGSSTSIGVGSGGGGSIGQLTVGNGAASFWGATIASQGGGGAHNNIQPTAVANWIIKT